MSLIALAQAASVADETPCCRGLPDTIESISPSELTESVSVQPIKSEDSRWVEWPQRLHHPSINSNFDYRSRCPSDWSSQMTSEERQFITKKIRTAYQRKAPTYDELLDACCAIEEEFVFMVAPSRLDYFKSGVQYEKRIVGKICCLRRSAAASSAEPAVVVDEVSRGIKRAKTQH